jgi:hypothetical protein
MLAYGGVGIGLILALTAILPSQTAPLTPDHLRLSRGEWAAAFMVLVVLALFRAIGGNITSSALLMVLPVLVLCLVILWFRGRARGHTLLDGHIPASPPAWGWLLVTTGLFFGAAVFGYNLPLLQVGDFNQLTLIGVGFTAYGLVWLPTISLVLGVQAYLRQMQSRL